jgi:hypothetical protein
MGDHVSAGESNQFRIQNLTATALSARSDTCATMNTDHDLLRRNLRRQQALQPRCGRLRQVLKVHVWSRLILTVTPVTAYQAPLPQATPAWPMVFPQSYQPQNFGNEFSVLSYVPALFVLIHSSHLRRDFLETLDDGFFFNPPTTVAPTLISNPFPTPMTEAAAAPITTEVTAAEPPPVLLPADKTEKFLLTAADQESGSRDERLNRVIRSKYEAGLLKPYNYVKGYARLSRWMENNVSQESKQAILQPLSILRPKFRVSTFASLSYSGLIDIGCGAIIERYRPGIH